MKTVHKAYTEEEAFLWIDRQKNPDHFIVQRNIFEGMFDILDMEAS